ncbi:non-ribosomal peptide synthetase [Lysinibacillus sp. NPDC059133]|uniref:non-ribosomal peptide synthetase n=1 Tax=Lysinibacillus sp. NPDC059133 TaxID=3346737 RepID=UPI0036BBDD08
MIKNVNQSIDNAYIMYTSGTTGRPKGVKISHKNVLRLVKNIDYVKLTNETVILQTGAISFDASTFEIWGALLNGGRLILIDNDKLLDTKSLKNSMSKYSANTMWLTSPLFNQLSNEDISIFKGLDTLIVGGDVLSESNINRLLDEFPNLRVINGYGPTENTTFSTTYTIENKYENIPIGKPVPNSKALILNKYNQLQPIGIPGELCLGGDGLSKGYINNHDLTQEKFIPNPFNPNEVIYKTGDLARWLPDGNIEFWGRVDKQVKIRGFRVELGDIERNILNHPKVKEAIVVVNINEVNKEKRLFLYYTLKEKETVKELKNFLIQKVPNYMIPTVFIELEAMPLTINGKIDTKELPIRDYPKPNLHKPAQNDIQQYLVELWVNVLGIKQVGISDDFFELGGNSLSAVLISSRIQKHFTIKFPFSKILRLSTIEEISKEIISSEREEKADIQSIPIRKKLN